MAGKKKAAIKTSDANIISVNSDRMIEGIEVSAGVLVLVHSAAGVIPEFVPRVRMRKNEKTGHFDLEGYGADYAR